MGIAADIRAQLSGLFRDESGSTEAAQRFQAALPCSPNTLGTLKIEWRSSSAKRGTD